MEIVDCYLRALQKAEENMTNGGIKLDKARFVQLFNDEQNRLVRYILDKKNEEDIRYIQKLVVYSKELDERGDKDNPESTLFSLPSDFFLFQTYQAYLPKVNARSLILPCGRLRTKTLMSFLPTF